MSSAVRNDTGFSPEAMPDVMVPEGERPVLRLVGPDERAAPVLARQVVVEPVLPTEIDPVSRLPKIFVPHHLRDRMKNPDGTVTFGPEYRTGTVPIPAEVPVHLRKRVSKSDGSTLFIRENR